MKIALGTVVYNESYKFHKDFVESVNNQDVKDFDVLILNDDLSNDKKKDLISRIDRNVVWIESISESTIPELRIQLIEEAKDKGYDLLVLIDFDDTISKNRISEMVSKFDYKYSFFYNELYYLDDNSKVFKYLPENIDSINEILECNFLGLGNTALNIHKIDYKLLDTLRTKQTKTFDWVLFSLLLLKSHKGKKVSHSKTYYRIHDFNTAGRSDNNIEDLKKEIEIKIEHYSKLQDVDSRYRKLLKSYIELRSSLEDYSDVILKEAFENNNYWWGNINIDFIKRRKANEN